MPPTHDETRSSFQTAGSCLAIGVAFGAVEAIVRYWPNRDTATALDLAVAIIVNIAVLGAATLCAGSLALVLVRGLSASVKRSRTQVATAAPGVATAIAIAGAVFFSGGLGLTDALATTSVAAATGLCGAIFVTRGQHMRRTPILSRGAKTALAITWALCVATTHAAYTTTRSDIDEWLVQDDLGSADAANAKPNVLLVVLDTLRLDRVGVYGDSPLTPEIDALAKESIVYTNAFSTAPWTLPTHASLFTGLYPSQHGVSWGHFGMGDQPPTIAEIFKERGYGTYAVSNNCLLGPENGYDRGFDSFIELSYHRKLKRWKLVLRCGMPKQIAAWMGLEPDAATDQGAALTNWILKQHVRRNVGTGLPSFTFVNYYEPHDPYEPPKRYREMFMSEAHQRRAETYVQSRDALVKRGCGVHGAVSDEELPLLEALYDADVAYQDERFGELVDLYRNAGVLDNTWLIVTSDHGELFGEHGRTYHSAGTHHNLLHVPLIVRPPGGVKQTRINAPVQPVDIFATLVSITGGKLPEGVTGAIPLPLTPNAPQQRELCVSQTYGASLFALSISQRADMPGDLTRWLTWMTSLYADGFMLDLNGDTPTALYDVRNDPDGEHNLLETKANVVRSLLDKYQSWKITNAKGDHS